MGERADRCCRYSDQCFAAVCEPSLLQFGFRRSHDLRVMDSGWRIWKLLAAVWRGAGLVAVRYGFVVLRSNFWMELCGLPAVGLGSVPLRKLDFFAWTRMDVGALGIWLSRDAVASGDGGIRAFGKFRWIGSATSHGQKRQKAHQYHGRGA